MKENLEGNTDLKNNLLHETQNEEETEERGKKQAEKRQSAE